MGHSYFMEPGVKSMRTHISNPSEFGGIHTAVFCHLLDIQTEFNLSIKSDFFNPEKDNIGLTKFSFEVLYVIWLAIVQHNSRKWYLFIQGPDSCHTIRFPFSPYLPNEYILFLFLTELVNLTTILYQNKLYHFFLAGNVRHATWIDTSWSWWTWKISLL